MLCGGDQIPVLCVKPSGWTVLQSRSVEEAARQLLGVPAWDLSPNHVFQPGAGMTYPLRTDFQVGGWSFGSSEALSSSLVGSYRNSGAFG